MNKDLLVLLVLISIYILVLMYIKIYPKIDYIQRDGYKEVLLWYNNKNGERLWVHLFNI